jgi:trehalose-6-phosphate synthase
MPAAEEAARMAAMRAVVRTNTVFHWAARLLEDGVHAAAARTPAMRPELTAAA